MKKPIIAPSLLAADPGNFESQIAAVQRGGAQYLHLDIMDGHFVPNLSFGPGIVAGLRDKSPLYFDVHLMIEHPEHFVIPFIEAGADCVTIHAEAEGDVNAVMRICAENNVGFGIALKPRTPVETFARYYKDCEILLIMSVDPGFGGQAFMPTASERIARAKSLREELGANYKISVDGGINMETAPLCVAAGVDILVAGSAVFKAENPASVIAGLMGEER